MTRTEIRRFCFIAAALVVGGFVVYFVLGFESAQKLPVPEVPPPTEPLESRDDIVGEWRRVRTTPSPGGGDWRVFTSKGEFLWCCGDVINWGKFRFAEIGTLETTDGTSDGRDGETTRWTVGRSDDRLVLVHQLRGWVEQYVKVPPGTFHRDGVADGS